MSVKHHMLTDTGLQHSITYCKCVMRFMLAHTLHFVCVEYYPLKDGAQTALFKDPVRTAL
jgi:hypothetical protein